MITSIHSEKKKRGRPFSNFFIFLVLSFSIPGLNGCATVGGKAEPSAIVSPGPPKDGLQVVKNNAFILGPGDKIQIEVYRHDDLKKTIQIDPSGKIAYPFIGEIEAGGLSTSQLKNKIQAGLSRVILDPQVFINIPGDSTSAGSSIRSQNVIILGEVKNPGLFGMDRPLSAIEMVAMAGGFTTNAEGENVFLLRGGTNNPEMFTLNLKMVLSGQDLTQNVPLQTGDILYVPVTGMEKTARFFDHLGRIFNMFYQAIFTGIIINNTTK
jgi:polysaccharide biosynthesis/export protein